MQTELIQIEDYLLFIDKKTKVEEGNDCILSKDENKIFNNVVFKFTTLFLTN